jgi:hypothetical protein
VGAGEFCERGHGRMDGVSCLALPRAVDSYLNLMTAFPTVPNESAKHQNEGTWT